MPLSPTSVSMPLRHRLDGVPQVRRAQRRLDLVRIGRLTVSDVVRHRVVEQHHVLAHHRDLAAQRVQAVFRQRDAVDQNLAAGRIEEARQQIHQRGLAAARRARERHHFARRHLERHLVERVTVVRGVAAVGERHVAEFDFAASALERLAAAFRFGRLVDQAENQFARGHAALQRLVHVHQVLERRDDQQHRRDERDKAADRGLIRTTTAPPRS